MKRKKETRVKTHERKRMQIHAFEHVLHILRQNEDDDIRGTDSTVCGAKKYTGYRRLCISLLYSAVHYAVYRSGIQNWNWWHYHHSSCVANVSFMQVVFRIFSFHLFFPSSNSCFFSYLRLLLFSWSLLPLIKRKLCVRKGLSMICCWF